MIEKGRVDLWIVPLGHPNRPDDSLILDAQERSRSIRFVFERDRRRYVNAHAALRRILAGYVRTGAARLQFATADSGKPALAGTPAAELDWNLSHSADLAVIGVARGTIGVDIECLRPMNDAAALAAHHFTGAERDAVSRQAGAARDRAFLEVWTRKEACLKAVGAGLFIDTRTFECGADEGQRAVSLAWRGREQRLVVQSVPSGLDAVVAIAVAAAGDLPQPIDVRVRRVAPPANGAGAAPQGGRDRAEG